MYKHSNKNPLPRSYTYPNATQLHIPTHTRCHKATYTTLSHSNTFLYINVYSVITQLHIPHCHTTSHCHTVIHTLLSHSYTLLHILWYHTFLHIQRCHTCNYTLCYRKYPSTWLRYASPGHSIYDS